MTRSTPSRRAFLAGVGSLALATAGTPAPAAADRTSPADRSTRTGTSIPDGDALESFVDDVMAARIGDRTPGATVAVVRGEDVPLAKGYGVADAETGHTPYRPSIVYHHGVNPSDMHWRTDSTLQRRMVAALALSVLGYAAIVWVVVVVLPDGVSLVAAALLVLALAVLVHEADRIAYVVTKAVSIGRDDYPTAYDTLHRLAQQADVAPPALAVVPTDEPNAITAGRGDRAVVCVTLGLLKTLDDDQIEAVLAHEIAHLKNGDTAVMTVAGFPATLGAVLLSLSSRSFSWKALLVPYLFFVGIYLAVLGLPLLVASLPGLVVLSRYREYAADRGAVALTGNPVALATALGALYGAAADAPDRDLRAVAGLTAFAIVPTSYSSLALPSMHPPTAERIRRLKELTRDVDGNGK